MITQLDHHSFPMTRQAQLRLYAVSVFRLKSAEIQHGKITRFQAESRLLFLDAMSEEHARVVCSDYIQGDERLGQIAPVPTFEEFQLSNRGGEHGRSN